MHKIERLEELHSLIDDYLSSKDLNEPLLIFSNDSHDDTKAYIRAKKGMTLYAMCNFPHDSKGIYHFQEPSDCPAYEMTFYTNVEAEDYIQYCCDIASKMHKPTFLFAYPGQEALFAKPLLDAAYYFTVSFDSWMEWAKQLDDYNNPNIIPWITEFLEHVGESKWAEHKPSSWEAGSDGFSRSLHKLLWTAKTNHYVCEKKSLETYNYHGIHPQVIKDVLSNMPEDQWKEWIDHALLMSNYLDQDTMTDGRYIDIEYVPDMTVEEKMGVLCSKILQSIIILSGEKDVQPWTRHWTPRQVDLDMIEYFHIPVHEPKGK